jgi:hypothetical protein
MTIHLVCDADGLIKVTKAGLLQRLVAYAEVIVGPEVWREVVEAGLRWGHDDAAVVAEVAGRLTRVETQEVHVNLADELSSRLGAGEREAWALCAGRPERVILTDDRAFLWLLAQQSLPALTPAAVVVLLVETGALPVAEAREALGRLRPHIREEQYVACLSALIDHEGGR